MAKASLSMSFQGPPFASSNGDTSGASQFGWLYDTAERANGAADKGTPSD
jgi:hypothetical protein